MQWKLPVCVFYELRSDSGNINNNGSIENSHDDEGGQSVKWGFECVVEITHRFEVPSVLQMSTVSSLSANSPMEEAALSKLPMIILRNRLCSIAYTAGGDKWDCTGYRYRKSSRFHIEDSVVMLHYDSLLVNYAMAPVSGRLMLAGWTQLLSNVLCFPRVMNTPHIAFIGKQRCKSIVKQIRDKRVVVDTGSNRAATYRMSNMQRVDSLRGL